MMQNYNDYRFYVDISGTIKNDGEDIFVGCILFKDNFRAAFKEKFYRDFPSLKSFNKKGASLNHEKLKKILEFMNKNSIKMSVVILQGHTIKRIKKELESKIKGIKKLDYVHLKDFEERIMGLAYFHALKQHAWNNHNYDCYFCMESQYKIQQAFTALNRISYTKSYSFRSSCTPRRIEHMLKFADFVASAGRKIDKFILDQFQNLKYVKYEPTEEEINIVFCLSRREKSKRNI